MGASVRKWSHGLLLVTMGGMACATGAPRQTALMETIPGVNVSSNELKLRVRDFQDYFAATVEDASNEIVTIEENRSYKVNSYLWRTNSIAAVQAIAFQADPLAALGDLIIFSARMRTYLESNAAVLFGESYPVAVDAARTVYVEAREFGRRIVTAPDWPDRMARLDSVALASPMTNLTFGQVSDMTDAAAITASRTVGGLSAVASIDEVARDLSGRMNVYYKYLPKQFRWQIEMFTLRLLDTFGDSVRADVNEITSSIQTLTSLIDGAIDTVLTDVEVLAQETIANERAAILSEVDRQRVATLLAVRADLEQILEDVQRQRAETLVAVDSLIGGTERAVVTHSRELVDHVFIRVAQLLIGVGVGLAVLIVLYNVTRKKRALA